MKLKTTFLAFAILSIFTLHERDGHCGQWTWQSPSPTVEDLSGIWGSSSSYVFAVGKNGTILHYDGSSWSAQNSGTSEALNAVWGNLWSSVYAVGNSGLILHNDSAQWTSVSSGTDENLNGIWGSSGDDIFAVGDSGTILHYDGSGWSALTSGITADLNAVCGRSSSDVYAVGDRGVILHYDGTGWSALSYGVTTDLNAVYAASSAVYAAGQSGTILRYSGGTWSSELTDTRDYHDILGLDDGTLYAVGSSGRIAAYDGTSWSLAVTGNTTANYGIWGDSPDNIFICSNEGVILRRNSSSWEAMTLITDSLLYSVTGFESSRYGRDLFVLGENQTVLYRHDCDGATVCEPTDGWLANLYKLPVDVALYDAWGNTVYRLNSVYAVGEEGTIYSFNATDGTWTEADSNTDENLNSVWGISFSNTAQDIIMFAVGDSGTILYYNGSAWKAVQSVTDKNLQGVWGDTENNFFAVGNSGTILHYDGSEWGLMDSGTAENLRSVWGSDSSNVFAVGRSGTILHYDGSSWTAQNSGVSAHLNTVYGADSGKIFAGGNGVILEYNNSTWEKTDIGNDSVFWRDIWGGGEGDIFFVGGKGIILAYTPDTDDVSTTSTIPDNNTTTAPGETTTTTTAGQNIDPPGIPGNPYPDDNATGIPLTATLQWSIDNADTVSLTFDIYFGTEEEPPLVAENADSMFYTPEEMNPSTVYYWKITAKNSGGTATQGPTWSFTTGEGGRPCIVSTLVENQTVLKNMRAWRDRFLLKTAAGRFLVDRYYDCSDLLIGSSDKNQLLRKFSSSQSEN